MTNSLVDSRPGWRSAPPRRLRVAGFNVLNYFTTLGSAARCGPASDLPCRGAANAAEFQRQRGKIIAALYEMNADIVGLVELENNPRAAIADLINGLNDAMGDGTYAFVDTGTIGRDVIKVGFIYKPASVGPIGPHAILDQGVDGDFDATRNRPSLAVTFRDHASGERITVAVNHFKSKRAADLEDAPASRPPADLPDCDQGDGRGYWNHTRTRAARALVDWLAGDNHVLIIGDLNAYAGEDPIRVIEQAGYTDLIHAHLGEQAYSVSFDGRRGYLDHALASASLRDRIAGVTVWHINADPSPNSQQTSHHDACQSSDHDPVIIDLNL